MRKSDFIKGMKITHRVHPNNSTMTGLPRNSKIIERINQKPPRNVFSRKGNYRAKRPVFKSKGLSPGPNSITSFKTEATSTKHLSDNDRATKGKNKKQQLERLNNKSRSSSRQNLSS